MWISFGVGPAVIDYCFMLESYEDLFRVFWEAYYGCVMLWVDCRKGYY